MEGMATGESRQNHSMNVVALIYIRNMTLLWFLLYFILVKINCTRIYIDNSKNS